MNQRAGQLVLAGRIDEWDGDACKVVSVGDVPVLVLRQGDEFCAVDNRCPHMGFPLHQGDVADGLLDCHWHHARFDVTCGATLDPWADDVDSYRVVVADGNVYVDPARPPRDPQADGLARIARGLEHNLRLVIAKGVLDAPFGKALEVGARFGGTQNDMGWRSGLTILSCVANIHDALEEKDRARALTKALAWIAAECEGRPPRRPLPALNNTTRDAAGLCRWLRETIEVRDSDGAERVLRTLMEQHGLDAALDAVLKSLTDHRYGDVGHTLDFAIKCAELAERVHTADPELAVLLMTSLVPQMVQLQRMEETNAWRRPIDVAAIVARFGNDLPEFGDAALDARQEAELIDLLLADDPEKSLGALVDRLRAGTGPVALADAVVEAAITRILRFGKANEVPDWDTVHHTLTYANAVAEGMRRVPSRELFRGVLDGAASVYLDRFLNLPPAPLPKEGEGDLLALYDLRASVDDVASVTMGNPDFQTVGHAVLREDAGFHDYQQLDIAWRRLQRRNDPRALVAAARWLAARYPTQRAQEQTFSIARRLRRGDTLFEA